MDEVVSVAASNTDRVVIRRVAVRVQHVMCRYTQHGRVVIRRLRWKHRTCFGSYTSFFLFAEHEVRRYTNMRMCSLRSRARISANPRKVDFSTNLKELRTLASMKNSVDPIIRFGIGLVSVLSLIHI